MAAGRERKVQGGEQNSKIIGTLSEEKWARKAHEEDEKQKVWWSEYQCRSNTQNNTAFKVAADN